jgi:hypothetical protein
VKSAGRTSPLNANYTDLCGGIDLCLPNILPLAQYGCSYQPVPVLFADEVRSLEKDGRAIAPRHSLPPSLCGQGALDCPRDSWLICLVICTDMPSMVRRNQLFGKLARLDLCISDVARWSMSAQQTHTKFWTHRLPIYDDWDLKRKVLFHLCDCGLQSRTFGRARCIGYLQGSEIQSEVTGLRY